MKIISLIAMTIFAFLSLTLKAETREQSLAQCLKIEKNTTRLACYDALAQEKTSLKGTQEKQSSPLPPAKAVALKTPAENKIADFGAEHLKKSDVDEADLQIVSIIESLSKDQYGKWRITFKNGQQWKQSDNEFLKLKVGESVLLKKGFLNAVYLKKNQQNLHKKIRVKRLK